MNDEVYEDVSGRTFFRVVGSDPPTLRDFFSYRDLGRPLFDPSREGFENWTGVSVYERRRQAVALAKYLMRRSRPVGTLIVEIVIPAGSQVIGKRMGGEGHYNLFADPQTLLGCYHRVVAVLTQPGEFGER